MAETIVKLVLEKVTDPIVKEVLKLCGVEEQVEKVRRDLDWIRAFLMDADMKQIQEERQKQWVREVREVAYRIEDVIDTFLCEVPEKKPGKREVAKRFFEKTKKLPVIHKLGKEINRILTRLKEIRENKETYGIHSLGEDTGGVKKLPLKPPVLPDIEDPDVVGLDKDRDNIIKQLLDETNPRRCVISIFGPGGLGKTTLAKKVYNSEEVRRTYGIRIWVMISQEFKLIDVLKKILQDLRNIDKSEQEKDEEYFLTELNKSLKNKKYLLIIDDVWTTGFWMAIGKALPNDKNGSRILMTTRKYEVAKDSDSGREPYKLEFLTEQSSQDLFLKKAFPNEEIQTRCSADLFDLTKQFVKLCGGLPLALVVLGGMLAKKEPTYYVWNKVMQTMNWHTDEPKACTEIIATSFDDLPLALKSCFMYFAAFPEDHSIEVKPLLRMWIAEGFIPQEENRTLEDTAQSFLEDLAMRSMVQVSERSLVDDSITRCRIHDLMREVAIQKAKEDNFMTVCLNQDEVQGCGGARRVAIHNLNGNELMKYQSSNLRTLLCFESKLPDCFGHGLLKVLHEDENYSIDEGETKNLVGQLSHLRYLQLGTSTSFNKKYFEKLIGNLKFLQSINLENLVGIDHFPDCIWHVKTLRHVILPHLYGMGPPPLSDLRNLHTLQSIKTRESWKPTNLPNMPNLRILHMEITEGFPLETLVAFLRTLEKLEHLRIRGKEIPIEVVDVRGFPFYQHLLSLNYEGRFSCHGRKIDFETAMFPPHITSLSFFRCELQQDHLEVLEQLRGLKLLYLIDAYPNSQSMRCSTGGFPRLQELFVWSIKNLEVWEIEDGAMPLLKSLDIRGCPMLQVPHGLQHLTALRELSWYLTGESGTSRAALKEEKIRHICQHVPTIELYDVEENTTDHHFLSAVDGMVGSLGREPRFKSCWGRFRNRN